ncbi:DEAD/DEAH box helicase [Pseudoxanthomonas indica]|uniref:ATP-dependent RNA helicase DeaD n=1 Tax=Pseudoxanthomonas indica TaxID=428993 RepID=A0A1T5LNV1_9GAMM|nr:DEAD/DEAH box helicase [Pseudoxanthomonas indica]GGD37527.1 ATP-dependent RNA helicase DeaD [Pseudoxanthomonas indica]SKC77663.1 ATP-dependent RNA helicase CsdA [Pseudoxanthomonas indica]
MSPPSDPTTAPEATPLFADLGLSAPVMAAVSEIGYETPSPIQAATIPAMLGKRDVLGQAQTGTGKTAAFALPLLSNLDLRADKPQALVLTPTRELAIQVAEAFQKYASKIPGFHVLPIYGGQSYYPQLQALKRGVHVVVGTPGRVIDHLERGSLDLSGLTTLVLDEADEMLRMGFIDDVETVLKKTPESRQVALFSATMPPAIRRIAQTYLKDPVEVTIAAKTTTSANIRQRYWFVSGLHKLDALTRILEAEPFDAMIIFARTKAATEELAGKLQARGLAAAAINGDMQQAQREKTIQQLKDGKLDILVATDVAARGLDVERISHVLNFDIPYDTESYVHRIGRTGRAGRTGDAILFVTPREKGMLRQIERATRQPIQEMQLPSIEAVNDRRVEKFLGRITDTLAASQGGEFRSLIETYERENNVPAIEIAAALARLLQGDTPLLLSAERRSPRDHGAQASGPYGNANDRPRREYDPDRRPSSPRPERAPRREFEPRQDRDAVVGGASAPTERRPREDRVGTGVPPTGHTTGHTAGFAEHAPRRSFDKPPREKAEVGMETFRIEVGHTHGVKPANIVGAIANEAGLESRYIGRIDIRDDHSLLDLPEGMPSDMLVHLKKVWVSGQQLRIHRIGEDAGEAPPRKFKPGGGKLSAGGKPDGFKPGGFKAGGFKSGPRGAGDERGPGKPHRKGKPAPRS